MDMKQVLLKLKNMQAGIRFESEEDEGAAMHWSELEAVINAIESGKPEDYVRMVANNVAVEL